MTTLLPTATAPSSRTQKRAPEPAAAPSSSLEESRVALPPADTATQYSIEVMNEGFWDGSYRLSCGFRVIGLYESPQDAHDEACLDYAKQKKRIRISGPT
mgnify:CR=1 FL=1